MEPTAPTTPATLARRLIGELRAQADAGNVAGMARFGISPVGTLGVTMPVVRGLVRDAKRALGRDLPAHHELAVLLWDSGVHEARIMAAVLDAPSLVTPQQAESWVAQLDSWDTCDQLCLNLLRRTPFAWEKAAQWTAREPEFTKRAGFVLIATLAVHEKAEPDTRFLEPLTWVAREATNERNNVKKAANWALRQIGKRSVALNAAAIETAERILCERPDSGSARWIARDALRELKSPAVRERLGLPTA